jgi:hypothetical protein
LTGFFFTLLTDAVPFLAKSGTLTKAGCPIQYDASFLTTAYCAAFAPLSTEAETVLKTRKGIYGGLLGISLRSAFRVWGAQSREKTTGIENRKTPRPTARIKNDAVFGTRTESPLLSLLEIVLTDSSILRL